MAKKQTRDLTEFWLQRPKPRRGPKTIHQQSLINRRDGLVQVLEWHWGEIGLAMRRCTVPKDVGTAFEPLCGRLNHETINLFCRPSAEFASREEIRKLGKQLKSLIEAARKEYDRNQSAQERLNQARAAVVQAPVERRPLLERELSARQQEAQRVADYYQTLGGIQQELNDRLRLLETAYAHQELFGFIRSKRYELNPLSLANAVAGLPEMSWRQSIKRCGKNKAIAVNGSCYQAFKAIRYLVSTVLAYDEASLVKHFMEEIPQLPKRHAAAGHELGKLWFFLERAIKASCVRCSQAAELPFEITKRYVRSIESQTAEDVVLAEKRQL